MIHGDRETRQWLQALSAARVYRAGTLLTHNPRPRGGELSARVPHWPSVASFGLGRRGCGPYR
jgi:hypothetical protein